MPLDLRIEGYAIVSEDGMLANAAGIMPDTLKFEADHDFFEQGLDGVEAVVHGRHSNERQPRSYLRRRLIVTRRVPTVEADPSNEKAPFWKPVGASFEQALAALGASGGRVAIIGGTDVFGMFLDRYDVFFLSRAPGVRLPGGRPVFPRGPGANARRCACEPRPYAWPAANARPRRRRGGRQLEAPQACQARDFSV